MTKRTTNSAVRANSRLVELGTAELSAIVGGCDEGKKDEPKKPKLIPTLIGKLPSNGF